MYDCPGQQKKEKRNETKTRIKDGRQMFLRTAMPLDFIVIL